MLLVLKPYSNSLKENLKHMFKIIDKKIIAKQLNICHRHEPFVGTYTTLICLGSHGRLNPFIRNGISHLYQ